MNVPKISYETVLSDNFIDILYNIHPDQKGNVELALQDGNVVFPIKHAIFNALLWSVFKYFKMDICVEYGYYEKCVTNNLLAKYQSTIFYEVIEKYPERIDELKEQLFLLINKIYQFAVCKCIAYQSSIDIFSLNDLLEEPSVKEIVNVEFNDALGIPLVEKQLNDVSKKLNDKLLEPFNTNILYPFHKTENLSKFQIPQFLIAYGPRTDIDDTIVLKSVHSSAVDGLKDIDEAVIESLSAKKSAFYNHSSLQDSQYSSRRIQLVTSYITQIYDGDCGNPRYTAFTVTKQNCRNLIGKYIKENINDPIDSEILLFDSNVESYIDKVVYLRSAILCSHKVGCCERCGGFLAKTLPKFKNSGIHCGLVICGPVSQKILSNKHLTKTSSLEYKLPKNAFKYFVQKGFDIFFKKTLINHVKSLYMCIPLNSIRSLSDLSIITKSYEFSEVSFSKISTILFTDEFGNVLDNLDMYDDTIYPFLSKEFLLYIEQHKKYLQFKNGYIWIPLINIETTYPILKSTIKNDSTVLFVKSVMDFLNTECISDKQFCLENCHTVTEALEGLTNIIYNKVNVNIFHIELLLKAYIVKNKVDYSIPDIIDPNNVTFSNTSKNIDNRTLSGKLAFEKFYRYLIKPSTYLIPKHPGPFDIFFNI